MTKKLLFSIIAIITCGLMHAATSYGIYVNGTEITSSNLSFSVGSGTVSYNVSDNKLYVSNVTFSRSGDCIHVKTNSNRADDDLWIVFRGTNRFASSGDAAFIIDASTTLVVESGKTYVATSGSGKNALAINNTQVNIEGDGIMQLVATAGTTIKGQGTYTNTTLTFDIKECQIGGYDDGTNSYVASNQQRISNINKVIVYKHGNLPSSSDPYLYSTKITLYKTGSSSYPQTSNINSWTNASGVTMLPTNTQYNSSSKALTNSSYALYNYDIVISNMQNNSSYTAIGNYLYKKGSFNGSSCATLVAPTYNYFNSAPTSISVPGYVTLSGSYLPVYIGQDAFSNWQRVQSITLCYGVAGISAYAMQYMDNLQAIYIPSSVKSIGSYAFKGSSGTVGNFNVFWSQSNVGDVISTYSFYDIQPGKSNKKVYFPTWLDANNANRVSALTNIMTVQTGAGYPALCHDFTYNGNAYVVHDATNNKVALVGSATSPTPSSMSLTSSNATFKATTDYGGKTYTCNNIASYAFYGQTSLISFTTSYQGIEYIGEHAFDGCTKLTSVTLPEGLKTIWNNAFSNTAITSLSIPASVTSIKTDNEGDVFSNCQQLSEINVASGNSYYSSHNAILYNKAQTTVLKMPEAWAYYGYHHIGCMQDNDGIGFPSTLTTIGPRAFSRTNKVQSIFLPYGVTTIGAEAFRAAKALQAVHIPSSVTSCNWTGPLFYYCTSLKEINIALVSPPVLGSSTLEGVPSSCAIYTPAISQESDYYYGKKDYWKNYTIKDGGFDFMYNNIPYVFYNSIKAVCYGYFNGTDLTQKLSGAISIPSTMSYGGKSYTVNALEKRCFKGNTKITSVVIPSSVTYLDGRTDASSPYTNIEGAQFDGCTALTSLTLSPNIKIIPNHFAYNTRLTEVILPYGVTKVGYEAFAANPSLKTILFPSSVTYGWCRSLKNCSGLERIINNTPNGTFVLGYPDPSSDHEFGSVPKTCYVKVPTGQVMQYRNSDNWAHFTDSYINAGAYDIGKNGEYVTITKAVDGTTPGEAKYVYTSVQSTLETAVLGNKITDNWGRNYVKTALSDSCFVNFQSLKDFKFDSSWSGKLTTIPPYAFYNAKLSGMADFSDQPISSIGDYAFYLDNTAQGWFVLPEVSTWPKHIVSDYAYKKMRLYTPHASIKTHEEQLNFTPTNNNGIYPYIKGDDNPMHTFSCHKSVTLPGNDGVEFYAITKFDTSTKKLKAAKINAGSKIYKGTGLLINNLIKGKNYYFDMPENGGEALPVNNMLIGTPDGLKQVSNAYVLHPDQVFNFVSNFYTVAGQAYLKAGFASGNPSGIQIDLGQGGGLLGDVNGDGEVNVQDVTALISYILGTTPTNFVLENANVNQDPDGNIDVQDVTALINMILN